MNLPIRFPSDVDVIIEEVARNRALSVEERVKTLGELIRAYQFLAARSVKREAHARFAREDEESGSAAIEEFVRRHAWAGPCRSRPPGGCCVRAAACAHALTGGLAVGLRGRPCATKDADFILHVPAVDFPGLLEELAREGFEIDLMEMIRQWSSERFLAFGCGQVRVDWMQPVIPPYARVLDTAAETPWLDTRIKVATAEGVILTKMV